MKDHWEVHRESKTAVCIEYKLLYPCFWHNKCYDVLYTLTLAKTKQGTPYVINYLLHLLCCVILWRNDNKYARCEFDGLGVDNSLRIDFLLVYFCFSRTTR